eukprot:11198047-Lingulodinium_polyedra.AAC.1
MAGSLFAEATPLTPKKPTKPGGPIADDRRRVFLDHGHGGGNGGRQKTTTLRPSLREGGTPPGRCWLA